MAWRPPHLSLWLIGAAAGLVFGVGYWFAWGCRACAKGESPVAILLFCAIVGAVMARAWGKDHLRTSR